MANPDFLDVLGDEMGRVYEACSDRIVINLARYFKYLKPDEQPGGAFVYQAQKLQEFGRLTRETMTIITEMTGGADRALIDCLQTAILDALETVEPELRKAAAAGLLNGGNVPPQVDPRTMEAFRLYYQQAADKLNLVNTVMLESTENAYRATVSDIVNRMQRAQTIVDTATGEIVSGVESFNQALKQATEKMVENGITGFVDHAGRQWRPEVYVAMDMRTTFHNVARRAFWDRNADYANDLYLVSQHPGARPLCYPRCRVPIRRIVSRHFRPLGENGGPLRGRRLGSARSSAEQTVTDGRRTARETRCRCGRRTRRPSESPRGCSESTAGITRSCLCPVRRWCRRCARTRKPTQSSTRRARSSAVWSGTSGGRGWNITSRRRRARTARR